MNATLDIIGVRHHSPACARLVEARIRALRPNWVLIEGPSDFNERIDELLHHEHEPPIAVFSYYGDEAHTQHSFAPFCDYSPEWLALRAGAEVGAALRFIDLPYWHPDSRGRSEVLSEAVARARQRRGERALAQRLGLENGDALWDHLFEQALPELELAQRLAVYFDALRGDDPGDASDRAREDYMARWIRHTQDLGGRLLVVCGGWHRPALLQRVAKLEAVTAEALQLDRPDSIRRSGSFLIPYSDRRLEALGGYGAGVQSPAYYRWLYHDGAERAAEQAQRAIISRLRAGRQPLSTAHLIAADTRTQLLAKLRGHPHPLRADVLDGLLDAMSQDALAAPPPWQERGQLSMRDDPALREALLALTGDRVGRLAPNTPLPPLVFDVQALLERQRLDGQGRLQLDRHSSEDRPRAETLWRLRLLSIPGFTYEGSRAAHAARQLKADQHPIELWQLSPGDARHTALIEAGAYGPTLQAAAQQKLVEQLNQADDVDALAELYASSIRAGYSDLGQSLLPGLHAAVDRCHDHGQLARAGGRLIGLLQSGIAAEDLRALLQPALNTLLQRVLWLLEGLSGPNQPAQEADVDALRLIDRLIASELELALSSADLLDTLQRLSGNADLPPALRGAGFAVLWRHGVEHEIESRLLATVRGFAQGEPLGDFLYGLFALARNECARSDALLGLLDQAVAAFDEQDFLRAAPALRQAFHYFPPRERAEIALRIARRHGSEGAIDADWLRLPCSLDDRQRSARLLQAIAELRARFAV